MTAGKARDSTFSRATAQARVAAVLDDGARVPLQRAGRVVTARGTVDGAPVRVAASDPASAHGAIGTEEASALIAVLEDNDARRDPVLWLLDSAGANVEQGLAALGAFRRLFRAALAARVASVPMLALLGRSCFGGASMLACVCHVRSYLPQTRLATSGPAVIERAGGKVELDASDQRAVSALMGSASRCTLHPEDGVRDDTLQAARAAACAWLRAGIVQPDVREIHAALRARLQAAGLDPGARQAAPARELRAVRALLPPGYEPFVHGTLFRALPAARSARALFAGALGGAPIGARACWVLADWLLAAASTHPGSPLVLVLDAEGHAATAQDERLLLTDYLVHLSLVIAHLRARGHRVALWIPGRASGASYVAFAAPAQQVSALPAAQIAVLPARAVQQILGTAAGVETATQDWFTTGVADALLDARLAAYRDAP